MQFKDENILAIGMITMSMGLLIGQFSNVQYAGVAVSFFLEGLLIGLSIVMNAVYIVKKGRAGKKPAL